MNDPRDPRLLAAFDLLGRTGARDVSLGYHNDVTPIVWFALGTWSYGSEAAGALDPLLAVMRLVELALDGGQCAHCGRASGVNLDWELQMPLSELVCWYTYDPELKTFRRACEGETKGKQFTVGPDGKRVGRNDPCPCDSGKKFKECHGR